MGKQKHFLNVVTISGTTHCVTEEQARPVYNAAIAVLSGRGIAVFDCTGVVSMNESFMRGMMGKLVAAPIAKQRIRIVADGTISKIARDVTASMLEFYGPGATQS